jgi:DNA replication protein DnaC
LLIDDLGKQKMTERAETELYDVLEHRTNNLKPTLVTTNATGQQLARMLSEDRRQPIIRRIKDFSTIVKYEK